MALEFRGEISVAMTSTFQHVLCCPKGWISVSGIVFATGNGGAVVYPLALQNGWVHYGDPFAPPQYFLSDGICSLQGLISGDLKDSAALPAEASFHIMSEVNANVSLAHCRGLVLVSMLRCQFHGSFHQFSPSFPYRFHVMVP